MALISFINILTVVVGLVVILPAQLDAYYTQNTGCHHNGSWYADKSLVPTTEKCLNCQCLKKTLVCRLKVCPEMPMPPPRGCVVVQKKNTCCPYLSCARLDAFYKIPATRRIIAYLDHYERESIDRVVNENMLQRRSDDNDVDLYVCVKNGTVYKSGSAMSSSNLCSYCYCIGGTEKCVKPKCMLPVEGCKPIFVDSTCCPVRYDCSTKQTGKSSQEVRYRKTSNKHYMRMSQRLQRNRGCIVGEKFYAEGQKMKTDKDKPCDICFCIRGQRKCAPKKCAPALRNCIPVVPKGHCCPSSYDCGSQRDYRRSQNSRQFNLFSLLFGKDEDPEENAATEISVEYPHDREPPHSEAATGPSTEKSMYDTIREGLEFIDNNNNQMLKDNMDLVNIVKDSQQNHNQQQHQPSPTPIPLKMMQQMPSTTEVSFFDLLLGPSDPNAHKDSSEELEEESIEEKTTPTSSSLSWVDLLLGPNEDDMKTSASTISDKIDKTETTRIQDHTDFDSTTTIDRLDHDLYTSSEESLGELPAEQQDEQWTSTTDATNTAEFIATDDTTQTLPTTLAETTEEIKATEPFEPEAVITTMKPTRKLTTTTTVKPKSKLSSSTQKPLQSEDFQKNENLPTIKLEIPFKTTTPPKPEKNSDFLAAFWDGLSDILEGENKTRHTTNEPPSKSTTPKPLPVFKPLPLDKTYTRINSKIANLTIKTPFLNTKDYMNTTFKPMPVHPSKNPMIPLTETLQNPPKPAKPTTSTTTSTTTTTTVKPSVAPSLKPLILETNPTILEAESLEENSEHTLPPSLPNLKIIPFLPADAVEADHNQPSSYDFYHHSSGPISRVDYDLYDDANVYPSITEKYPLYPDLEDGSKAEYIYKFNVEGPDSTVSSPAGKFDGTLGSPAFVKYDFTGSGLPPAIKGFSPPTKTEGGFMPKEPLNLDVDDSENVSVNVGDSYKLTEHLIDITTSGDIMNTTKIIEITTPDPFKDVIRTELPPDLTSLIEDKLKNFNMQSNKTITKTKTATSQPYDKPQTRPNIELHTKQAEPNQMNSKITKTQFKMTHVQDSNNNGNKSKHNGEQEDIKQSKVNLYDMGNDDDDDDDVVDNVAANDVSTIPPFKTLPQAVVKQFDKENITKAMLAMEQISTMKLKQNQTTLTPTNKTKITKTIITTSTRRPTTTKTNRTKTIATNSSNRTKQQQKLTKTKTSTSASSGNSETRVLASSSSSSSSSSAGTVSTLKTKPNATRRVTSPKPTKHYKPTNRPTTTTTTTTTQATTPSPTRTTKSTSKPNAINIDITSAATRRTTKPTMAYNNPTRASKPKISTTTTQATTTKQTTSAKPTSTTTMRTTSLSTSLKTTTNPFFMSPFDKLPFMDASFEVKRNSATPPSFTSSKHQFAVAANVPAAAASTMLENAGENDDHDEENDGDGSSMHNLMGLVHYKHKLNQLEGLEPSTQRPQHSSASASFSSFSEQSSASSSSSSSQQHHSSPSSSLNNLIDPTGILKLAGCNIYGRMYRVGRIILELSSPCLECKCTEIGVKCGPLEC